MRSKISTNRPQIKRILVPLDGSDYSFRAAEYAILLSKMSNADILCLHCIVNPPYGQYMTAGFLIASYIDEAKKDANIWYDKVRKMASNEGIKIASTETILDISSAADSIVDYADKNNVDLIVIGTKGRTRIKRFLVGSVASGVVMHSGCPVLVIR